MTLIQGAGVSSPDCRMVTYSVPFLSKPPSPLKNSSPVGAGDGGANVRGFWSRMGAYAGSADGRRANWSAIEP